MPDIIININFIESKKKSNLVLETFKGFIPNNKGHQYSGQLRNININGTDAADNLTHAQISLIRDVLNNMNNVQINKYQFLIATGNFSMLQSIAGMGCLFYKDKNTKMNQIDSIIISDDWFDKMITIGKFSYYTDPHSIIFFFDDCGNSNDLIIEKQAKLYVDIQQSPYVASLEFQYGSSSIKYASDSQRIGGSNQFRDYSYEQGIVGIIKDSGWQLRRSKMFEISAKYFAGSIKELQEHNVEIYTRQRERVSYGAISNFNFGYGIDWFEIHGKYVVGDDSYQIADLIRFSDESGTWARINGNVVVLPERLTRNVRNIKIEEGHARIKKNALFSVIDLSLEFEDTYALPENFVNTTSVSVEIDKQVKNVLRDYQMAGVKWLLSLHDNGFGGCLADDMGLGKTLQAIAYLTDTRFRGTTSLIVVPKTLLENWRRELLKFAPKLSVYIYHGSNRSKVGLEQYSIVLSTYGTVMNDVDILQTINFENLVMDEAQKVKNSKSNSYKAMKIIKAQTRIALTGTPMENNLKEYWSLMRLLNPEVVKPYSTVTKDIPLEKVVKQIRCLTAPFILRRYKEEVLNDLPAKNEQTILCDLNKEQRNLYDKLVISIREEISRSPDAREIVFNAIVLKGLLYLQELCCHPQLLPAEVNEQNITDSAKLDVLIDRLQELYSGGHKVVVFSRFTRMLRIIEKVVAKLHMNYYYLDGDTADRMDIVDEFEQSEQGIFLISLKAGGIGLNIVSADTVFIFDPWWNPAVEQQAEDRVYRIGQRKNVTVYKLIATNTIEEKIQELQTIKMDVFSEIMEDRNDPAKISIEDLRNLINVF